MLKGEADLVGDLRFSPDTIEIVRSERRTKTVSAE